MGNPIYLDGLSSTPLRVEALAAMTEAWSMPGNAGSPHAGGAAAAATLDRARREVAALIGASAAEIVFTSGATEANNLAIRGAAMAALTRGDRRRRIVISAIEHRAVLKPTLALRKLGFNVVLAPVHPDGTLDLGRFAELVDADTLLTSVMAANNETGVVQPVAKAAAIAREAGALVHCDAAQAAGRMPLDVFDLDVDYVSLSAHKMHGPMGVGALYVASSAPRPAAQQLGGEQEQGIRAGTEPVPIVAGFGAAAAAARERMTADATWRKRLLARLLNGLERQQVPFGTVSGSAVRVEGAISIWFPQVDAESLVQSLANEVCISTGSACTAGTLAPSHVLMAMGLTPERVTGTIRIYCSPLNTECEMDAAGATISNRIRDLR